jgi:hypothetical protein
MLDGDEASPAVLAGADNCGKPMEPGPWVTVLVLGVGLPVADAVPVAGILLAPIGVPIAAVPVAGAHGEDIRDPHNAFPLSELMEYARKSAGPKRRRERVP